MSARARRRQRLIGILALILLALLGAIVATQWQDKRKERDREFLAGTTASEARHLRIERPGRDAIVITRAADAWQVEEPCRIRADGQRLDSLLDALSRSPLDYAAMDVDREAAGLTQAEASVFIDDEAVQLGGKDLSGERRYAQRGDRIALVPEWVLSLVNGGLSALASRDVFRTTPVSLSIDDTDAGDVTRWLELVATQVAVWPIDDAPPETHRATLLARFADAPESRFNLVANASWTALMSNEDGACAQLFASELIPAFPE